MSARIKDLFCQSIKIAGWYLITLVGVAAAYVFWNYGKISFNQIFLFDEVALQTDWVRQTVLRIIVCALAACFVVVYYLNKKTRIWLSVIVLIFASVIFGVLEHIFYNIFYSNFYEKNYKILSENDLTLPDKKRNLIVVYLESMEQHYDGENVKPFLDKLQKDHVYFDGFKQLQSAYSTIASQFAGLCGLPLKNATSTMDLDDFFPSNSCVSDVLKKQGYSLAYLKAADIKFSAAKSFAAQHGFDVIKGYFELKDDLLKKFADVNGNKFEGLSDKMLFEAAKVELKKLKQPFMMVLTTLDMHHLPHYFVDKHCSNTFGDIRDAVRCVDKNIESFLSWLKKQDFYKNTTVVFVGDHIGNRFNNNAQIFNVFVNPSKNLSNKKHKWTTYDLAPTLLESVGIKAPVWGLGRSLSEASPTLIEKYKTFDYKLMLKNKLYNGFAGKISPIRSYKPYKIGTVLDNKQLVNTYSEINHYSFCYLTSLVSMNIGGKPSNNLNISMNINTLAYPFDILFNNQLVYSHVKHEPVKKKINLAINKDWITDSGNIDIEIKMKQYNRHQVSGICMDDFSITAQ